MTPTSIRPGDVVYFTDSTVSGYTSQTYWGTVVCCQDGSISVEWQPAFSVPDLEELFDDE